MCAPLAGCICRDGFFRSPINNQCISKEDCDRKNHSNISIIIIQFHFYF